MNQFKAKHYIPVRVWYNLKWWSLVKYEQGLKVPGNVPKSLLSFAYD